MAYSTSSALRIRTSATKGSYEFCNDIIRVVSGERKSVVILNLPFGGFITLGILIAVMQYALKRGAKKKAAQEHAAKEAALIAAEEEAE